MFAKQGFGTYKIGHYPAAASGSGGVSRDIPEHNMYEILIDALEVGFRLFDCADFYGNHVHIGDAFEKIFAEVWNDTNYAGIDAVKAKVRQIVKELKLDSLDVCLVHWPVPGKHVETYKALEEMKDSGVIKHVGLSNYCIEDYEYLKQQGIKHKPVLNQLEVNPFLFRENTINYFQNEGIEVHAYRSLLNGKDERLNNPVLKSIADEHAVPVAKVCVAFILKHNIVPISKSTKRERMEQNYSLLEKEEFELTEKNLTQLKSLTTEETLETFRTTYLKSSVISTPLQQKLDLNKPEELGFQKSFTLN
eukprot:snap_masked-scaffold_5-processed-gene-16.55-mRNA-1 protein AED:0.03 eAED:0.03 QI:0/0/0/1/1/1/2/0/305